jgi:hypothetical protein
LNHKYENVFVKDLKIGDKIVTTDGLEKITDISKSSNKISMFDVTVDSQSHLYYTNDILSHNTTTAALFIAHQVIFNYQKNILFLSKTGKDAIEVLNKTKDILKYIPFYMKPGLVA